MAVDSSDRVMGSNNVYNAVFTDKASNDIMDHSDFLNLLIVQMQNQDFMNPMDDTQFVTQMAQFSMMQQMTEMAGYSKTNYAMSLVGKTVTASRYTVGGSLDTTTGAVQKVSLVDNEYVLYIGGKKYTLGQVMEIQAGADEGGKTMDLSGHSLTATNVQADLAEVSWEIVTEDEIEAGQLKFTVYYSTEGPFDTLEAVKAGTRHGSQDRPNLTTETVWGLTPETTYYINVVVKGSNGAEQVYQPVKITTAAP